ncbi:ZIP family metal transporter [Reichenbachiella carrageenanivorans]|uniref:ZIP family metal transporter n=1 Tax=Reichenbachiella carrageenanivorans TaxID=2979869 RepID=A0ABY6D305_9BACT|nr:ZIP family metal transporter [Reichenbachiella carrageenanivorans]UXX80542.1 ZIP family metal transporter [Reichenbachiella carrageenanivorans]
MIVNSIVLFLSALVGGLYALRVTKTKASEVKSILVFAGSFLFSITIVHILPELFETHKNQFHIGMFILGGFFFQQILEYFTNGVEHGHMHVHKHDKEHSVWSGVSLMAALCMHSFLEGTILAHPEVVHSGHSQGSLLTGVVLHKIPAALALMTVLACQYDKRKTQLILLFIFALASPLGVLAGHWIVPIGLFSEDGLVMLFAFVAGNFLHISTTIFIESSPEHRWNSKKLLISIFGAGLAILAEVFS